MSSTSAVYRNICAARQEPGRELTVICGNNGQGKTNLLEAIWLLTGGKSFRGGKDADKIVSKYSYKRKKDKVWRLCPFS